MKGISQLLSLFIAHLSFLVVWLIVLSLAIAPASVAMAAGEPSLGIPRTPVGWLAGAAAGIVGFYGSFAMARYVARLFPIKLSGTPRIGLILTTAVAAAMYSFIVLQSPSFGRDNFLTMMPMTALLLGTAAWTLFWQTRSIRSLNGPFILYLRRFSSFADRSLMAAFLRARGHGYRAVFLTPVIEAGANLGPMVTAFSGTRLWRPLASCPIPVAARSVDWQDQVEELARAAACIVIDVSDRSPAIALELEIVERCKSPDSVLWLADQAQTDVPHAGRVVRYRRSWPAAMPRIVLEMLAVGACAFLLANALYADPRLAGLMPWLSFVAGFCLLAVATPVIVQPSVSRQAHREIRDGLREILASPHTLGHASRRFARKRGRHSCIVLATEDSERAVSLCRVAERAGLASLTMQRPTGEARLRQSIRQLRDADLVVADVSQPDADVDYLIGVAHGLGRKVVLTAEGERAPLRGTPIWRFAAADGDSGDLRSAIEAALRDPLHQGPAAAVLADDWVFGEQLAGRRALGFLLDATVSTGLAFGYLAWHDTLPSDAIAATFELFQAGLFALVAYQFVSLVLAGTTPGMALAGLRVIDADGRWLLSSGQALGRSVATYVAVFPFSAALLALFGPRYQTLEDVLSGTRVVRR